MHACTRTSTSSCARWGSSGRTATSAGGLTPKRRRRSRSSSRKRSRSGGLQPPSSSTWSMKATISTSPPRLRAPRLLSHRTTRFSRGASRRRRGARTSTTCHERGRRSVPTAAPARRECDGGRRLRGVRERRLGGSRRRRSAMPVLRARISSRVRHWSEERRRVRAPRRWPVGQARLLGRPGDPGAPTSVTSVVTLAPEAIAELKAALEHAARPRLTYTPEEACQVLGVSRAFFYERIRPELRVIRRGKLVLIPVRELERWLSESAERVFDRV